MHLLSGPQCWFPGAEVRKHSQSWAKPASQSGTPGQQARWFSLAAILQGKSSKAAKALWEIWGPREVTHQNVCPHMFPCLLGEGHWQVCVFHIYNACFLFLLFINYVFEKTTFMLLLKCDCWTLGLLCVEHPLARRESWGERLSNADLRKDLEFMALAPEVPFPWNVLRWLGVLSGPALSNVTDRGAAMAISLFPSAANFNEHFPLLPYWCDFSFVGHYSEAPQ